MTKTPQDGGEQDLEATRASQTSGNKPERLEWFQDLGLGLFIHWSLDSQLGMVISHSLVGASPDYAERFFTELPRTFYPHKYDPDEWARQARLAGVQYVVFTTKHHSGFCMFETRTTDFGIMHTPYPHDLTRLLFDAFRKQGIGIGIYFSPDDFHVLWQQGIPINRGTPEADPLNNPRLMQTNLAQLRELLTGYGPIDMLFLDGQPEGLKELAWQLQPEIVVTRGAIATPEQTLPDAPLAGPWESCFTMGTQWQFKPTNENYKSGQTLIQMLIETRAKGGNLLLNVGPRPDGELAPEQSGRINEMGLWLFVNREAIYQVRPRHVTHEGDVWFTCAKNEDAVYAMVTNIDWAAAEDAAGTKDPNRTYGRRLNFTLKSVRASEQTQVQVLGHAGKILEYRPSLDPTPRWHQDEKGLHLSVMSAHRIYNMWEWKNPIVVKITHPLKE
ncbi:MAG: alpha-L-fucosidase [Candidatus Latescibacteria bacterium]|nr:alpha-L-fucosidase [Candidatus Latescibacterota bacterium]